MRPPKRPQAAQTIFSVHSLGLFPMVAAGLMAAVKPFAALRPDPELAGRICELPYDVMSTEEARRLAKDNPLSFLRVSKAEIELPPGVDPTAAEVYARARANFERLILKGALRQDAQAHFYLYRQVMGRHSQTGLVALASCADYLRGTIKRHESTRPDKEDDRVRHIEALNAQTGPVFLVHRTAPALGELAAKTASDPAEIDFVAADGVRHTSWTIRDPAALRLIESEFARLPSLYIADGHHRCAAAARVFQRRHGAGGSGFFLAVIFPQDQVQILPYHRVLADLNGLTPPELLARLEAVFVIKPGGEGRPARRHELGLYLAGRWHTLRFRPQVTAATTLLEQLDVALLQQHVLAPMFGIDDPRTSRRIQFVGGIRGPGELERLVNRGEAACAFALFPTGVEDLLHIADAGGLMPPKSTWFEPKLRDAMFCHVFSRDEPSL